MRKFKCKFLLYNITDILSEITIIFSKIPILPQFLIQKKKDITGMRPHPLYVPLLYKSLEWIRVNFPRLGERVRGRG